MKYAIIKVINGNYFIHSEGITAIETAKVQFHGLCQTLWNAPDVATAMVMIADGNTDHYTSIGQLDAKDWFVVGAGDYNGDGKDDLLVRQYSTGMLGYYGCADQSQWVELGRGVDMDWTVIS